MPDDDDDEPFDISSHCSIRLESPPDCSDFFGMRSYVMCWAQWKGMRERGMDLSTAIKEGWKEARRACKVG